LPESKLERTLAIIKPDATARGLAGDILSRVHRAGFSIVAIKSLRLTRAEAEGFYAVHHCLHELREDRCDGP
jgi:nucleoside-diphosphate kinase